MTKHVPDRTYGDEHPFRAILKALETGAAVESHAMREGLVSAIIDYIQDQQLEPYLARDIPGPTKRVNGKVRTDSLTLPVP